MPQKIQRSYTAEYRINAVNLAKEIGGSAAAQELKVPTDTLYAWISKSKRGTLAPAKKTEEKTKPTSPSEQIRELERRIKALENENAQIRRENEILEDAAAFFAARRKKSASG